MGEGVDESAGEAGGVLESIDRTETSLWSAAIGRCRGVDGALADELVARLAGRVRFPDGSVLPVWTQSAESLRQLRDDLLANDLNDAERVTRARAWLDAQPPAAAWVIDDGGQRDGATGAPIASVVVANLSSSASAASVIVQGAGAESGSPELTSIGPWEAVTLRAGAPRDDEGAERIVRVQVGSWTKRLTAVCGAVPARPPGLPIGPLVLGIDNAQCIAAAEAGARTVSASPARLPDAAYASMGMLLAEPGGAGGPMRWTLYFECMAPGEGGADAEAPVQEVDQLSVFLGPSGGGSATRRIVASRNGESAPGVRVSRRGDRWLCWVTIPRDAIESDGRLRIGVVREVGTRNSPQRSSWPRPMFPWQTEPGRVCADVGAWVASSPRGRAAR